MPTRRYEIQLVVAQTNPPPPPPPPPPNPNNPAAPGSQNALDKLAAYATSVYAIRQAYQFMAKAIDDATASQERLNQSQMTATEKHLEFARQKRAYVYSVGGQDPAARAAASQDLDRFSARHGFKSESEAVNFAERFGSDTMQYSEGKDPLVDKDSLMKLRDQLADSAIAKGVSAKNANIGISAIIGSTNWTKTYGKDKAAANIMTKWERLNEIMRQSKGDPDTNWFNLGKYINQSVQPDRSQGRYKGEDALEKAALAIREESEYNPAQAEMLAKNRDMFLRQFSKKDIKKNLNAAGITYEDDPSVAETKLNDLFVGMRDAGKLPKGMTISDFINNVMKGNMRASVGTFASIMAKGKGGSESAYASAMQITPDNVFQRAAGEQATDVAMPVDTARMGVEAGVRAMGAKTIDLATIQAKAKDLFMARGHGGLDDPRAGGMFGGFFNTEMGGWRGYSPFDLFGHGMGSWNDFDAGDPKKPSDAANMMFYKEMVKRNHPGGRTSVGAGGEVSEVPYSEEYGDWFYRQNEATRSRAMMSEIQQLGGSGKAVELLQQLVDEARKQAATKAGVPLAPAAGGLIGP